MAATGEWTRPRELPASVYGGAGKEAVGGKAENLKEETLLRRFLGTMELGWQVWVQPDGKRAFA